MSTQTLRLAAVKRQLQRLEARLQALEQPPAAPSTAETLGALEVEVEVEYALTRDPNFHWAWCSARTPAGTVCPGCGWGQGPAPEVYVVSWVPSAAAPVPPPAPAPPTQEIMGLLSISEGTTRLSVVRVWAPIPANASWTDWLERL